MYMLIGRKGSQVRRTFADEHQALNMVRKICAVGRDETSADLMAMKALSDAKTAKVVISANDAHLTIIGSIDQ